ncbi:MAG: hypothetical protein JWO03_1514 [Bacteroidetes bacterium]|nr:hypothetical protein [Bacteroidota bacterium]
MKKKPILLLITLLILCQWASAQLRLGEAVVTKSGAAYDDIVVDIFDVSNTTGAPRGYGWDWTGRHTQTESSWDAKNLGQVFGLAINTNTASSKQGYIYASSTQIYGGHVSFTYDALSGYEDYSHYHPSTGPAQPGQDGAALIWELQPGGGGHIPLVKSTTDQTFPSPPSPAHPAGGGIFNRGTGIGNICYDPKHDQIFATNMEDGRIYRIKASTGEVLSRYKPSYENSIPPMDATTMHTLVTTTDDVPEFVDMKQGKLWGIAYANDRLYFAFWKTNYGLNNGEYNSVFSIGIDPSTSGPNPGEFQARPITTGSVDFADDVSIPPRDKPEFDIPYPHYINSSGADTPAAYSNPVADIEISADGLTMLLAERTMSGDCYDGATSYAVVGWAHRSRVLKYELTGTTWNPSADNFNVGNAIVGNGSPSPFTETFHHTNATGGVDFGYLDVNLPASCELEVWASGDALKYGSGPYEPTTPSGYTNEYIYGIAGIPIGGNGPSAPSTNTVDFPNSVNHTSIYQDIFSPAVRTSSLNVPKTKPGDVDIYRFACCHIAANLAFEKDTVCASDTVFFNSSNTDYYAQFTLDGVILQGPGDTRTYPGVFQIPNHRMKLDNPPGTINVGQHIMCVTIFSADPNEGPGWCSDEICDTIIVVPCSCEDYASAAHLVETHVGLDYVFSNGGVPATFVDWWIDADQYPTTTIPSDFAHTFATAGRHVIYMRAAYIKPGQNGAKDTCCYSTDSIILNLPFCEIWKAADRIDFNIDHSDPNEVHFYFEGERSHPLTVIWNFGDGTPTEANNGDWIRHHYAIGALHRVCATAIWSYHDLPVNLDSLDGCCCVDTVCVDVDPCNIWEFGVQEIDHQGRFHAYQFYTSLSLSDVTIDWTLDGVSQHNSSPFISVGQDMHAHSLCVHVSYSVGEQDCSRDICVYIPPLEISHGLLRYYPNPTHNIMTVEVQAHKGDKANIQIIDYLGRMVASQNYDGLSDGPNSLYLNLLEYSKGIYSMKVTVDDNTQVVKVTRD